MRPDFPSFPTARPPVSVCVRVQSARLEPQTGGRCPLPLRLSRSAYGLSLTAHSLKLRAYRLRSRA